MEKRQEAITVENTVSFLHHCGWRFNVLMEPVGYLNECKEADGQNIAFLRKLCDRDPILDRLLF